MLAAVLPDFNDLRLEEVLIPEPGLGEVVVRLHSCGICATDYKAIVGIRRNVTFPAVLGHEPSGIVARVGPGVIHFKEGDEVICQPRAIAATASTAALGIHILGGGERRPHNPFVLATRIVLRTPANGPRHLQVIC
jgi:threonine dehydrogenase-like Zn-dependent dehydrogenase